MKQNGRCILITLILTIITPQPFLQAQSLQVSMQEGLYSEEIEGDLTKAISIYKEIISKSNETQKATTAQAMYRLGLCYSKQGQEQLAQQTFAKLINSFPEQIEIVNNAQLLYDSSYIFDPAELMPPNTIAYVELGRPGDQIETLVKMFKDTPFENPLAVLGGAQDPSTQQMNPGNIINALFNPSMLTEFKKVRGIAFGVIDIVNESPDDDNVLLIIQPGKSDILKGLILTGLGMTGQPGPTMQEMETIVGPGVYTAYDNSIFIIGKEKRHIEQAVSKYKSNLPSKSLLTENQSFIKLPRKKRAENLITLWADIDKIHGMLDKMGLTSTDFAMADLFLDSQNIDDLTAFINFKSDEITIATAVHFKDNHDCLLYKLIHTQNLNQEYINEIPSNAFLLGSVALNEANTQQMSQLNQKVNDFTGLDIGREFFSNINQLTLFVTHTSTNDEKPKSVLNKLLPTLDSIGLKIYSNNSDKTYQVADTILRKIDQSFSLNSDSLTEDTPQNKYLISDDKGEPLYAYIAKMDNGIILTLNKPFDIRQLNMSSNVFEEKIKTLPRSTSKLVALNIGGALNISKGVMNASEEMNDPNIILQMDTLVKSLDKTNIYTYTSETKNQFSLRIKLTNMPPMKEIIPPLMALDKMMKDINTTNDITEEEEYNDEIYFYPANNSIVRHDIDRLYWDVDDSPSMYSIYFGQSPDDLKLVGQTPQSYFDQLPKLEKNTSYYWRLDEHFASDENVFQGDIWHFTTNTEKLVHWSLDESHGSLSTDNRHQHNGFLYGTKTWTPQGGKFGGALFFDGKNDYIDINMNQEANYASMTYSLWVKPLSIPNTETAILHGDGWHHGVVHLILNKDGSVAHSIRNAEMLDNIDDIDSTSSIEMNQWSHIVFVYHNYQELEIYINGKLDKQTKYTKPTPALFGDLRIGGHDITQRPFHGYMDEIQIFNYPLNAQEIHGLFTTNNIKGDIQ